MDPKGNTKNEPGQNPQRPGPQESARQQEEPSSMKTESPRKCKICGSPNADGCGCEARQLREAKEAGLTENEAKALQEPEQQPESQIDTVDLPPAESKTFASKDMLEDILSDEVIIEVHKANLEMAKDVKTMANEAKLVRLLMADNFEGLCTCMFDTNSYIKKIVVDLNTIKEILIKKDEVKNAG